MNPIEAAHEARDAAFKAVRAELGEEDFGRIWWALRALAVQIAIDPAEAERLIDRLENPEHSALREEVAGRRLAAEFVRYEAAWYAAIRAETDTALRAKAEGTCADGHRGPLLRRDYYRLLHGPDSTRGLCGSCAREIHEMDMVSAAPT